MVDGEKTGIRETPTALPTGSMPTSITRPGGCEGADTGSDGSPNLENEGPRSRNVRRSRPVRGPSRRESGEALDEGHFSGPWLGSSSLTQKQCLADVFLLRSYGSRGMKFFAPLYLLADRPHDSYAIPICTLRPSLSSTDFISAQDFTVVWLSTVPGVDERCLRPPGRTLEAHSDPGLAANRVRRQPSA